MPKIVDHAERRERIADAVLRVTARDGLDAVSLRQVGAEAGVTAGMVQHYFPSKDSMMSFAMDVVSQRYEARITAAVVALGPVPAELDQVRAMLHCLIPRSDDEFIDGRISLAFQSYASSRPEVTARLAIGDAQLRAHLAGLLQAVAPSTSEVDAKATGLLGLAEGLGVKVLAAGLSPEEAAHVLDVQIALAIKLT